MEEQKILKPFLFRFLETDASTHKTRHASPERGGESNPREEEPPKEPTQKTPYGD